MKKYNPQQIEKKWQDYWAANRIFVARDDSAKPKKYVLVEFPFPSGEGMHMGHVRPYTAADVVARYYRMQNFEVMFPMGWDAFGLPTENYAIKHGKQPKETTAQNIANIKKQFQSIGYSFDWDREVNTTDPEYYKWTQWLFLQFFKAGLAYEATGLINWCPKDKTGLANEEVINGACERCGTKVEQKELRQWYLKITAYAEKLLRGLKNLPEWPEAVKLQQENWIGKSTGAEIEFALLDGPGKIKVFTTRPDTIFGATYLVVAPEHPLVISLQDKIANWPEVESYIAQSQNKAEIDRTAEGKDKTGVELQGVQAVNPANNEEIPVWVADYVLPNYGTGAIMAVPAHDERDFEFARKVNLPMRQVVAPHIVDTVNPPREGEPNTDRELVHVIVRHPSEKKFLALKWKTQPWQTFITGGIEEGEDVLTAARREVLEETGYKNMTFESQMPYAVRADFFAAHKGVNRKVVAHVVMFKLDDLEQGVVAEEEQSQFESVWQDWEEIKNLSPVSEMSYILIWLEHGDHPYIGEGVLINSPGFDDQPSTKALSIMAEKFGKPTVQYKLRDWVFSRQRYWGEPIPLVHCEKCGIVPVPEDQLPVLLPEVKNYEPTGTGESPLAAIENWVNITCPKCGGRAKRETNTMPQWAGSSWYYLRYTDPRNDKQFAAPEKLKHWLPVDVYFGGMEHTTLHLLYSRFWNIFLADQGLVPVSEPYTKRVPHGIILATDGSKMSKSKGEKVNPDDIMKQYGADTLRMYELFLGPHEASVSWSDKGIVGVARFLDRVWQWVNTAKQAETNSEEGLRALNTATQKISDDFESFKFNTVVSSLMSLHNEIKNQPVTRATMLTFAKLLYPIAPHLAEEINELLGNEAQGSLQFASWPQSDSALLAPTTANIVVQVNGKVKDTVVAPIDSDRDSVKALAIGSEKVHSALRGKTISRIIFIPNRLINLVVE